MYSITVKLEWVFLELYTLYDHPSLGDVAINCQKKHHSQQIFSGHHSMYEKRRRRRRTAWRRWMSAIFETVETILCRKETDENAALGVAVRRARCRWRDEERGGDHERALWSYRFPRSYDTLPSPPTGGVHAGRSSEISQPFASSLLYVCIVRHL